MFQNREHIKEHFKIPRSVQASIPIQKIYKDGIFYTSGRYSKTWRFFDINYEIAAIEEQADMFHAYCSFLNMLPVEAQVKITLYNRRVNQKEFNKSLLMQMEGDGLDVYRAEYNDLLSEKSSGSHNLIQEKYITISIEKKNIEEARAFFQRVSVDLSTGLSKLDSGIRAITVNERLQIFHDFFRNGEEQHFHFDLKRARF